MTQQPKSKEEQAQEYSYVHDGLNFGPHVNTFLAGWEAASKQVGEENRRLRDVILNVVKDIEGDFLDAGPWVDSPTIMIKTIHRYCTAALASVSDAGNKEETKK